MLNTLNKDPVCDTTTYSISICPGLGIRKKIQTKCTYFTKIQSTQSGTAFGQTEIPFRVLATSQMQILGALLQEEHTFERNKQEIHVDLFNLGIESLSFLTLVYTIFNWRICQLSTAKTHESEV